MPASSSRLVDLPQPDGPSRATNSPSSITRSMPGITTTSPKLFWTLRNSMRAIGSALDPADRHLHQIFLRGDIHDQARHQVEHPDRRDDAEIGAHDVVPNEKHVQAHGPVGVL